MRTLGLLDCHHVKLYKHGDWCSIERRGVVQSIEWFVGRLGCVGHGTPGGRKAGWCEPPLTPPGTAGDGRVKWGHPASPQPVAFTQTFRPGPLNEHLMTIRPGVQTGETGPGLWGTIYPRRTLGIRIPEGSPCLCFASKEIN